MKPSEKLKVIFVCPGVLEFEATFHSDKEANRALKLGLDAVRAARKKEKEAIYGPKKRKSRWQPCYTTKYKLTTTIIHLP